MALHISISLQKLRGYFSHTALMSNPITYLLPVAATTLLPFSFSSNKHPNLLSFLCLDLPCRVHEFCSHFLIPPYLFLLLNFVIISIVVTSPTQEGEVVRKDEEEACHVNDEERDDDEESNSCKEELSSSLQQVETVNVKALPLPPLVSHLSNHLHSKDEALKVKALPLPPPPPPHLSNHNHSKDQALNTKALPLPPPLSLHSLSKPSHNNRRLQKSATWNHSHQSPRPADPPALQKSKTFHAHDPTRSNSSFGDEDATMSLDELNIKIEAFIAKINNQIRLQSKN